jgi:redox-sensitive bicupin YhaK (pirin superfamily)
VDGSLQIKQDAHLHQLILSPGKSLSFNPQLPKQYLHVIAGQLQISGETLGPGDGLQVTDEGELHFVSVGENPVKALVFELP